MDESRPSAPLSGNFSVHVLVGGAHACTEWYMKFVHNQDGSPKFLFDAMNPLPVRELSNAFQLLEESSISNPQVSHGIIAEGSQFEDLGSHRVSRYIRTTKWILLLLSGYGLNRLCAKLNLPDDAQHHTWFGHTRNISDLILLGFLQGWFVGLIESDSRWKFLSSSNLFLTVFLGTGPTYSLITSIQVIDESVAEDTDFSVPFILSLCFIAVIILGFIFWHVKYAFTKLGTTCEARIFVLSRLTLIGFLGLSYYLIHSEANAGGVAKLHLHHYFVAWTISLFGAFNHRWSAIFLAITCGIFVQGISVYGAGSMFYRDNPGKDCPELRSS